MIDLVRNLKARHGLKVVAIGNEGFELAAHRIEKFALKTFIDLFIFSCFVPLPEAGPRHLLHGDGHRTGAAGSGCVH